MPDVLNVAEIDPDTASKRLAGFGESIEVRDFDGRLVEAIRITADGRYETTKIGIIAREQLGNYILRVTAHPARQ